MALSSVVFALLAMPLVTFAQNHVAFDRASASSVYSSSGFSAGQALDEGSGYWCRLVRSAVHWPQPPHGNSFCSSGNHASAQTVTWTGVLDVRRSVVGIELN